MAGLWLGSAEIPMDGRTPIDHTRTWTVVTYVLCALGALRILLVVLPVPMYGYANNYDFIRVSAQFDLWPIAPDGRDFDPLAQHPSAPLRCYRVDRTLSSDIRYPSLELGVVWLALRINDVWRALGGASICELDLRVLGLLRAALLVACGLLVTRAYSRRSAPAGVASALLFAIVLADPAVTLLFNTLYGDFSAIVLAYLASAQIVYAIAFAHFGRKLAILLAATLLALAATKTQFAGLAIVLVTVLAVAAARLPAGERIRARPWPTVLLASAVALTGLLVQQRTMHGGGYMWSMRMDAATNVFFGVALKFHSDPERGLAVLGLPQRCRPYVGLTWYDEGMQPPPCPEVGDVSRARLIPLLLDEPSLAVRVLAASLPRLQPLVVRDYGQVEGARYGQADDRWQAGLGSVSRAVEALPLAAFSVLLALSLLAGLLATVDLVLRGPRLTSDARLLPALTAVACAIELYAYGSSLLGGGLPDLGRHSLLGQLAFVVLLGTGPLLLLRDAAGRGR